MLTMKQDIHAPFVCLLYVAREDLQAENLLQVPHTAFFDAAGAVRKQITPDVLQKFTEWGMESGVTQA